MTDRQAVICQAAQLPFKRAYPGMRFQEMAFDCVEEIVSETGVSFGEGGITAVVTCSDDLFDARTISDNAMTDAVGAHFLCEEKISMDGLNAVGYAAAAVLSGHAEMVLVVGHMKESQPESREICTNLAFDPFFGRPVGLDYLNIAALQADAFLRRTKVDPRHLSSVAARANRLARENPRIEASDLRDEERVEATPLICDPLREGHLAPVTDGACAFLLASSGRATDLTDRPVVIKGYANSMERYFPGARNLGSCEALRKAASTLYERAGIATPAEEIDLFEFSDLYAHQALLYSEACGLVDEADLPTFAANGGLDRLSVNLSGGSLPGAPLLLGGMGRICESWHRLRLEPDGAVPPRRALAHGSTGPAGQHQAVMLLERAW